MLVVKYDVDIVFFFKQKTAYEMRISDWSSDVCSSDLLVPQPVRGSVSRRGLRAHGAWRQVDRVLVAGCNRMGRRVRGCRRPFRPCRRRRAQRAVGRGYAPDALFARSEEHTSELQSLMRISYAVFCLKKKKINTHIAYNRHYTQN